MRKEIAVLPGDGIGPEVINQAVKVLKAIADRYEHTFDLKVADIGAVAIENWGEPLPKVTLDKCLSADAVLLGSIGDPRYSNHPIRPEQGLLDLRKKLGLYTNIRPIKAYDRLLNLSPIKNSKIRDSDFVIYRELTGGIYFGEKGRNEKRDEAFDVCSYSSSEIRRISTKAFEAAQNRKKKLCLVDKANVLESSRLWREEVTALSNEFPDVEFNCLYVDNAAMQIILNPRQFDVILCSNLFGDILSDEASVIAGSLGLLPSASIGDDHLLFEPVHGSYPQAAGKDIANPIASILSVGMMLEQFDMQQEAAQIEKAVEYCMEHSILTEDLSPEINYSCSQLGDFFEAVILEEDINLSRLRQGSSIII